MRRRFVVALALSALLLSFSSAFSGALNRLAAQQPSIVIDLNFEYVRQGQAGVITLSGPGLVGGVATALERQYPFFPQTGGFAALLAVPIEQRIKEYPITVTLYRDDGSSADWQGTFRVESGEFIREPDFTLPSDRVYLLDPDVQSNEDKRLLSVYGVVTPERFWEGQFSEPLNGPLTSPFGSVRNYNDGSTRRHTGYDFRAPIGAPILASASGRVVFARQLDIHGNTVIIDHGWGVFSAYSHLSEIYVVPGQFLLQGEVMGLSGNTGRSTGPHLHWEIAVNGVWVNPVAFIKMRLPT